MLPNFEWGEDKAIRNRHKHHVSFEEAATRTRHAITRFESSAHAKRRLKNENCMKKSKAKNTKLEQDDMRPEYDLRGLKGVRGKYYSAMRHGYTITIHRKNGATVVKEIGPKRTILLEPDVQNYFPDSASVNAALRSLIPAKRASVTKETSSVYRTLRVHKPKAMQRNTPNLKSAS